MSASLEHQKIEQIQESNMPNGILDILNNIPNVQDFLKKLQENGLPLQIGFELKSASAVAVMLFLSIGLAVLAANLILGSSVIKRIAGITMLSAGAIFLVILLKQDTSNQ